MFWLIGTPFAMRNFFTVTTSGVSPEFFEKVTIYWFSEGFGHLEKFRTPTPKIDPKKSKKKSKKCFSLLIQKMWFRQKRSDVFLFLAPGAPYTGRAH